MALTNLIYNASKNNDREQWRRSLAEAGLTLVDGSFEEGATVSAATDAVWHINAGQCYTWGGTLPKAVPDRSTPGSTGGVSSGAWVSVGDVVLRGQISDPDGANKYPEFQMARWRDIGDVRGWGAKVDGLTDDTMAIANAIVDRRGLGPVVIPGKTVSGPLTVMSDDQIIGFGRSVSKITLKPGSNATLIRGGTSLTTDAANRVKISGLWLYCADGSNTSGDGLEIFGKETQLDDLRITGFPGIGLHTGWTATDTGVSGMEGFFDDIIIEKSGSDNWLFEGPHDSNCSKIILIDAGQNAENSGDGLHLKGPTGNARWTGVHAWTNYGNKRMRYALHVEREASGNEFSLSHFEGAQTANVNIQANNTVIDDTCKIYYPWGGVNVRLAGSACIIRAVLMEEYKGIGLPLAKGFVFDGTYGGPSGCILDVIANGMDAGMIDFGTSGGYNNITAKGYSASTTAIATLGNPAATDILNITLMGGTVKLYRKDIRGMNTPVNTLVASGTSQADAFAINETSSIVVVSDGAAGSGIKLPSATSVGNGYEITIANMTPGGVTIKIYPSSGHQIQGLAVDGFVNLLGNKSVRFIVADGPTGKWLMLPGA